MITTAKKVLIVFTPLFILTAGLLLLDKLTAIDISSSIVFYILLYLATVSLLFMILRHSFGEQTWQLTGFFLGLVFCIIFGVALLSWKNDWKTQTIIYRNTKDSHKTIEYRMRAKHTGTLYDRQIVQVKKIVPYVEHVTQIDTAQFDRSNWARVDEKINEMELPGEYVELPCD